MTGGCAATGGLEMSLTGLPLLASVGFAAVIATAATAAG